MALGLIVAQLDPEPELEDEFRVWYETEHIPERLRVPGFLNARRFVAARRPRYVACYDLESVEVLSTPAYKNVFGKNRSPWTSRMLAQTRFFDRRVYEQILPGNTTITEMPWTALQVIKGVDRQTLETHVAELQERTDVAARLFVCREPAAVAGELMVFYTGQHEGDVATWASTHSSDPVVVFRALDKAVEPDGRFLQVPASARHVSQEFYQRGYTDGLPIIPPTQELVDEMVAGQAARADHVVGMIAPRHGVATIESLAINAVMAGCLPIHFPVVVAAVQAMLQAPFNLRGVQTTTHPCTPMLVISGPIRPAIGLCLGTNAMGEGTLANATIGRAVRLILRNLGGALPGVLDFTAQGSPARYSFVVAEHEELDLLPPVHTTLGYHRNDSVVTVFASEGPHNINDHMSTTGENFLRMAAGTMATLCTNDLARGGSPVLALGPEHAQMLVTDGFTRQSIQEYVFEYARVSPDALPRETRLWFEGRDDIDRSSWNARGIPIASRAQDIFVMVVGGAGRHSSYIPSFAFNKPVSQQIAWSPSGLPMAVTKPVCDC